jgi:hypothetical protein
MFALCTAFVELGYFQVV